VDPHIVLDDFLHLILEKIKIETLGLRKSKKMNAPPQKLKDQRINLYFDVVQLTFWDDIACA
jgi:hypothetical protein